MSRLWRLLSSEPCQSRLRSKSLDLHPAPSKRGEYIIVAGERQIVKPGDRPDGIVFRDGSWLVVYERWSTRTDSIVRYKYHYVRPDGSFFRWDMQETRHAGHPQNHLQATSLGNIRLPTGTVHCEDVIRAIIEQFVDPP